MNVAKWVLWAVLAMPFLELAAFIAVAATIGFGWALSLIFAGSVAGLLILRHAGGSHIARMRVALRQGTFTALQADSLGGLTLLAGILLLIPGFISDVMALALLIGPLRRVIEHLFGIGASKEHEDSVVDLAPEQWRRVPDPSLPKQNPESGKDERAE
ncbi:MAG TPA: FxsA family protein [Pseudolabrys sp.]|nr:FxsA family protein [Pseudolabrys sp.]